MIQGAQKFSKVFKGELDDELVHLIVTAGRAEEGRDEARDEITDLPEIIRTSIPRRPLPFAQPKTDFRNNIKYTSPVPSQGAKSPNYVDVQRESGGAIYDGRYPHDGHSRRAAPIHIFHPVFEAFICRLQRPTEEPTRRYLKLLRKIMDLLTQIRRPEWKRGRDFREALRDVLGHTLILEANDDDTRTDSIIVIEVAKIRIRLCLMEIKAEAGEGGCDPSTQAGLSVRSFWISQESVS